MYLNNFFTELKYIVRTDELEFKFIVLRTN